MKKQGGFTLIELVVVIVILGILAVTAAPRFLNLQSDARASSLEGLRGAMAGATGIVFGGSAIEGEETIQKTATAATTPQANGVATSFGYPTATVIETLPRGIEAAVTGLPGSDWAVITVPNTPANSVVYSFEGTTVGAGWDATVDTESGCFVIYTEATVLDGEPTIVSATDEC
ncbi:type II secretion system protein [Vibrio splendidus]|uniref:type II secretion system protein n=1 Tax=Vibrio splendidus TaxID=29497 RepID=UPI000C853136|nr:type II secretion system protein [Vibrio splendidus]PMI52655.1 MSHA biogenesis protein MshA [Vibrio splendidus]